ncbi:MAG: GntR family transcriptional regulator [Planctomycetota bacterium]|jgi:ABC-type glycerol-3-phosphate transport system substrate-binding protein
MQSKYITIADKIRSNIEEEVYVEKLPSEKKLAIEFETTEMTIRKSLALLVDEGLLVKKPPIGTFIQKVETPDIKISLNTGFFGKGITDQFSKAIEKEFPGVNFTFVKNNHDLGECSSLDLIRNSSKSYFQYGLFSSPYPAEVMAEVNDEKYYTVAFDVHRLNESYYGIPIMFSPMCLISEKDFLSSNGFSLDPYSFNIKELIRLKDAAVKNKRKFWFTPAPRIMARSLVYTAGDESNTLASVNLKILKELLKDFWPLLDADIVEDDIREIADSDVVLHLNGRHIMPLLDEDKAAVFAYPEELRGKTASAGEYLFLSNSTEYQDTAVEVAEYFLSPEIQGIISKEKMGIPVLKSAAIDSIDSHKYRDDVFFNEVKNLYPNNAVEYDSHQRIYSFVNDVIDGKLDFDGLMSCLEYEIEMAKKQPAIQAGMAAEDFPG